MLVVASNRGPDPSGGSSGGVVPLLADALEGSDATWICTALGDGEPLRSRGTGFEVVRVRVGARDLAGFYDEISNRVLWFAHHGLWDASPTFGAGADAAWRAYRRVNERFARRIAEVAGTGDDVLVHDYHLSLVPRILRRARPRARVLHFSHTPFATPASFRLLPARWRRELMLGLLGADVLGFAADAWVEDFLACASVVGGLGVNPQRRTVRVGSRTVRVRVYPIAVSAERLREQAATATVARRSRALEQELGRQRVLLRADRLEPSKNAVRGFRAFEAVLRERPRWRGRTVFLALLSPSRTALPEYRAETAACRREARRINHDLGIGGWAPIHLRIEDDHDEVLAAFRRYDALLVNPVRDGTNLVAMEGPVLNERDGALVLSREAGAWERLGRYALGVDPFDIEGTARSIERAFELPLESRRRRARGLRRVASAVTPRQWLESQLRDLHGR